MCICSSSFTRNKTYEKVNTIDISVDSVENIVYSFQASIKVQGEVEVVDNEQKEKITWSDNIKSQIKVEMQMLLVEQNTTN